MSGTPYLSSSETFGDVGVFWERMPILNERDLRKPSCGAKLSHSDFRIFGILREVGKSRQTQRQTFSSKCSLSRLVRLVKSSGWELRIVDLPGFLVLTSF